MPLERLATLSPVFLEALSGFFLFKKLGFSANEIHLFVGKGHSRIGIAVIPSEDAMPVVISCGEIGPLSGEEEEDRLQRIALQWSYACDEWRELSLDEAETVLAGSQCANAAVPLAKSLSELGLLPGKAPTTKNEQDSNQ